MYDFIRPEFFDIFGIFIFMFLICVSFWQLKFKKLLSDWILIIILIVGILGLAIDIYNVYKGYLL